jgi:hypothetical protein
MVAPAHAAGRVHVTLTSRHAVRQLGLLDFFSYAAAA